MEVPEVERLLVVLSVFPLSVFPFSVLPPLLLLFPPLLLLLLLLLLLFVLLLSVLLLSVLEEFLLTVIVTVEPFFALLPAETDWEITCPLVVTLLSS